MKAYSEKYVKLLDRALRRTTKERDTARLQSREQRHQIALLLEENARLREHLGVKEKKAAKTALRTATQARKTVSMQRQSPTVDVPIIPIPPRQEVRLRPGDTADMCEARLLAAARECCPLPERTTS